MVAPVSFARQTFELDARAQGDARRRDAEHGVVAAAVAEYDAWCEAHGGAGAFAEEAEAVIDCVARSTSRSKTRNDRHRRWTRSSKPRARCWTMTAIVGHGSRREVGRDAPRLHARRALEAVGPRGGRFRARRGSRDRRRRSGRLRRAPRLARAAESPATRSSPCWSGCTFARIAGASFGAASPCTRRRRRSAGAAAECLRAMPTPRAAAARPRSTRRTRTLWFGASRRSRSKRSARFRDGGRRRRPSGTRVTTEGTSGLPAGRRRGGARGGAPTAGARRVFGVRVSTTRTRTRTRTRAKVANTRKTPPMHACASASRVGGPGPESGDAPAGGGGDARWRADDVETLFRVATTVESNDVGDSITIHDDAVTTAPLLWSVRSSWPARGRGGGKDVVPGTVRDRRRLPCRSAEACSETSRARRRTRRAARRADGESLGNCAFFFARLCSKRAQRRGGALRRDRSAGAARKARRRGRRMFHSNAETPRRDAETTKKSKQKTSATSARRRRRARARARRSGDARGARAQSCFGARAARARVC